MAMPCPICKNQLGFNLEFILKNPKSKCPHCNTVFNFSVSEDVKSSFYSATHEIKEIKKKYEKMVKFT